MWVWRTAIEPLARADWDQDEKGGPMRKLAMTVLGLLAVGSPTGGTAQVLAESKPAPARLVLNVPATRLDVWRGDSLIRSFRVAVGSRAFPTPIGEFQVTELTWNPWWVPPPS